MQFSATFISACALLLLVPGPTNTLLAAAGANTGFRRALLLPMAEALGYALAVSAYLILSQGLGERQSTGLLLKAVAALWLAAVAVFLWRQPVVSQARQLGASFWQVFLTTLLNPKALLVGTVLIPTLMADDPMSALAQFLAVALMAGAAWIGLGASLPATLRQRSYRAASVIIAGFALMAAGSLIQT